MVNVNIETVNSDKHRKKVVVLVPVACPALSSRGTHTSAPTIQPMATRQIYRSPDHFLAVLESLKDQLTDAPLPSYDPCGGDEHHPFDVSQVSDALCCNSCAPSCSRRRVPSCKPPALMRADVGGAAAS